MKLSKELIDNMKEFKKKFNDVVPLTQIPSSVTEEELICAIRRSIEEGKNLLPDIFGYRKLESDADKMI